MTHTKWCIDGKARWEIERAKFVSDWPNHCKKCNGVGGNFYQYDPSAPGVSLGSGFMYDVDLCSECVGNGICPRCGKSLLDDEIICEHCGWNEDTMEENPTSKYECYCWE